MRRMTLAVAVLASSLAVSLGSAVAVAGPASAAGGGVQCNLVTGTISGTVALRACRGTPSVAGKGVVSGSVFVGTSTATVTWTARGKQYTTDISITTSLSNPKPGTGYCARKGFGDHYAVIGTVTANTYPDATVGGAVNGSLCINYSTGTVRQMHYGSIDF
jgi:hypothetical protein